LDSLRLIGRLEAELVLPGHGEPFSGLPERTEALLAHHQHRLEEVLALLGSEPGRTLTGYQIASHIRWSRRRSWDDLSGFERRLAVSEALAHVELLHARGQVQKRFAECEIAYFLDAPQ
jgi:glyoxylase-like metal-dependent hydrolase (beta-lactamase superfamily II)